MATGSINKEFYIGRYIYLTSQLEDMPDVKFGFRNGKQVVRFTEIDPANGKEVIRRLGKANPRWNEMSAQASERQNLEEQLKLLMENWEEDHSGSLSMIASEYELSVNTTSRYDSEMWSSFISNDCDTPNYYPVQYKNYTMRSQFEVDVAQVLDSLGVDYKYEVKLSVGGGKTIYPDMSVNCPEYNRCGFVEAMGGLDNMKYTSHNTYKLREYINAGLYPNRDIAIISADKNYFPDKETIKRNIGDMLSAIAKRYVHKKGC